MTVVSEKVSVVRQLWRRVAALGGVPAVVERYTLYFTVVPGQTGVAALQATLIAQWRVPALVALVSAGERRRRRAAAGGRRRRRSC